MKHLIMISILILCCNAYGQSTLPDLEKPYEDAAKKSINYHDNVCDTLIMNDKLYFFNQTPIRYFKGYTRLFTPEEVYILNQMGDKGYSATWIIKNNHIYFDHLNINYITRMNNSGKKLSTDVIKSRVEKLTGYKFNEEGLLPADWVEGTVRLLTCQTYCKPGTMAQRDSCQKYRDENQRNMKIVLTNGKLVGGISEYVYRSLVDTTLLNKSYFALLDSPDSFEKQKVFFNVFPSSFTDFEITYGPPMDIRVQEKINKKASDHILKSFGMLNLIPDTAYCDKLIHLIRGGIVIGWNKEPFSFLGRVLHKTMHDRTEPMFQRLNLVGKGDQFMVWYLYFNTMASSADGKIELERLKGLAGDKFPKVVREMESTFSISFKPGYEPDPNRKFY